MGGGSKRTFAPIIRKNVIFLGKYRVKFRDFVNFLSIYFGSKNVFPPKLTELLRVC